MSFLNYPYNMFLDLDSQSRNILRISDILSNSNRLYVKHEELEKNYADRKKKKNRNVTVEKKNPTH